MKQYEIRVSKTTTRIECALLQVHGEMQWKVFSDFVTAVCTTLLLSEHDLRCMIDMTKSYHLNTGFEYTHGTDMYAGLY